MSRHHGNKTVNDETRGVVAFLDYMAVRTLPLGWEIAEDGFSVGTNDAYMTIRAEKEKSFRES